MPESVFNTFDRAKARARQAGREIIDLSIGLSDVAPPEVALEALRECDLPTRNLRLLPV